MKLYSELSSWWPLLSSPEDYEEEAAFYLAEIARACVSRPHSLLELGCGGGNNAYHMKSAFREVVLTDVSPDMVAVSQSLNPECEHVVGDMRSLRLGRLFDCVFVHDAVVYMTTGDDLRAAIETAAVHCRPDGVALFAPTIWPRHSGNRRTAADMTEMGERFGIWSGPGIRIPTIRRTRWTTHTCCANGMGPFGPSTSATSRASSAGQSGSG